MFVYNTLSGKIEEFIPQNSNEVKMYVCGITPYDECHLGHARCYVTFDVIRRYLKYKGYRVKYVQNFTDIDDKIIERSNQTKTNIKQLVEKYINEYFEHCKKLNIKPADVYPKVTEHIKEIIEAIEKLIDRDYAYVSDGSVYFKVKKFNTYGKLSKRNYNELLVGVRIEPDEKKQDPLDFALWKEVKPDEPDEVKFSSPWGVGRPGWHIECSVMSLHELNTDTIDIHGGGNDLIFPHHENEIAQSEALTGKQFVKYWLHNGFVTVNKEKMSKSLGNFFSLNDIFEKFTPEVVRLFLLSQHYRKPLDFSDDKLIQAKSNFNRLVRVRENAELLIKNLSIGNLYEHEKTSIDKLANNFVKSMDDDFNTASALAALHGIANHLYLLERDKPAGLNKSIIEYAVAKFDEICNVLGLVLPSIKPDVSEEVLELVRQREEARKNRNWQKADELRNRISSSGYLIEDTIDGPLLRKSR